MFIDAVLSELKKSISLDKVLDLCAAPGGKSTILLDHLEDHQFLVSNEILPNRNLVLKENLTKWGFPNFLITENKPKDFSKISNYFDLILMDAPCSGEGLFRKDKNAVNEWSLSAANMCSERQFDIFLSTWNSLKDGGYLIYSTCTYNPDENEKLIEKLADEGFEFESIPMDIDPQWNIDIVQTENVTGYRFLPHKVKGEGFFCSILRKKGTYKPSAIKPSRSHINSWLNEFIFSEKLASYSTYKFKNSLYLAPNSLLDELEYLKQHLYTKQIGIEAGNFKGNQMDVAHGLTMLTFPFNISPIHLHKPDALQYLSKGTMNLSEGEHLLAYNKLPIGYIKAIKGKIENPYPEAWKIKKAAKN